MIIKLLDFKSLEDVIRLIFVGIARKGGRFGGDASGNHIITYRKNSYFYLNTPCKSSQNSFTLYKIFTMRVLLILTIAVLSVQFSNAQKVIASGGDFQIANGLMVSTTIGEPIIETFSGNSIILTQGFQQPKLTIVSIQDIDSNFSAEIYPNPTTTSVILETTGVSILEYQLLSLTGEIIQHHRINSSVENIDMSFLPANTYLLKLFSAEGKLSKVIKVQKIN